jgi:hypothetical protein
MNINNRGDIRNLIVKNEIETAKNFCEISCGWEITQKNIMVKVCDKNTTEIYDKFKSVVYILTPEDDTENLEYHRLIRQIIGKMFQEKYRASGITEETIKGMYFLFREVPTYLSVVPLSHKFFEDLWSCLKQCNIEDKKIGIAWVAAFNLPKGSDEFS